LGRQGIGTLKQAWLSEHFDELSERNISSSSMTGARSLSLSKRLAYIRCI
jgi:hypothetical protein